HPSSGIRAEWRGTYLGLTETGRPGGLDHLRSMNVNAVELLPCQEFANAEPNYQNVSLPRVNFWNPYARNHWGYMTSYFFAPESYYATDCGLRSGSTCGSDGRQVREFKQMVKALHRAGIAVILDVVYNHVSQYDINPFKCIDKKYYFRLDDDQRFLNLSGCGNDFKTERPMSRRLIIDSLLHWMREYHVDGFRFDLAAMLDDGTLDSINRQVREVNPRVLLIAEPWGAGKRDPAAFSSRGWASWNDEFRNGVKGQNPENNLGFIFGKWWNGDSPETVRRYVSGTTVAENGPFLKAGHAVNYLESHDDYSFGDFVRLGTGRVRADERIDDTDRNAVLTDRELRIHKLGAFFLLTSQGATMLHQGQEYARSKVIAHSDVPDPAVGRLDPNSYNKDNETNWIDYGHCLTNSDLVEYYRGMIKLRRNFSAFRRTQSEGIRFLPCSNPHALGYRLETTLTGLPCVFIVLMNGDADAQAAFSIPEGRWQVLADKDKAGIFPLRIQSGGTVEVPAASGLVLMNGPDVTAERQQRD
ncbi:MAG TPA: pullulanase, partial [bacterium]